VAPQLLDFVRFAMKKESRFFLFGQVLVVVVAPPVVVVLSCGGMDALGCRDDSLSFSMNAVGDNGAITVASFLEVDDDDVTGNDDEDADDDDELVGTKGVGFVVVAG